MAELSFDTEAGPTWQVYLALCADGTLYTGVARDLARRLRQHNGELVGGASYTRGRRPVRLLWNESCEDRSAAQKREAAIKGLSRAEKLRLVHSKRRGELSEVLRQSLEQGL